MSLLFGLILFLKRLSQSSFYCPSSLESIEQRMNSNSEMSSPFGNSHFLSVKFDQSRARPISCIFVTGRPSAIAWLIVSIIVNSINRVFSTWPWANICFKFLKAVSPLVANRDSSGTVANICRMIFVVASTFHPLPYHVKLGAV